MKLKSYFRLGRINQNTWFFKWESDEETARVHRLGNRWTVEPAPGQTLSERDEQCMIAAVRGCGL
jgi:hypothetical protein